MSIKIIYFVHGTTTDNEKEISSGWYDVELSELGVKQVKELREYTKGRKFDAVFCSDLKRAVDSAKLAFEGEAPIIPDTRLRECNYGTYNAKPSAIVEPMQEQCITKRFPEGESYEDVKTRIADFLAFLKKDYDGKSIAIVGHKAPQLALDVLLKGKTWEEAFAGDWRKTKSWKPGWEYELNSYEKGLPVIKNNNIDKLAWIYVKDGKVLSTRSRGKDTWYIPGGKRERDETDAQALMREIKEELSVDIVPETMRHYGTFEAHAHGKPEGTMVRMTCYTGDFAGDMRPAAEIEEYAWFGYEGKEKSSPVDKLIFDDLKKKELIG